MKRTVARQLAMVNWKGVFYERYLLDPGVTALEGTNGAGKTTVMVAAYVVLLPDKRYLRFEPLAEGDTRAEDRGIWGRLGEGDAYSAIDFRLGSGGRLLAGIRLQPTGKNSGELHPFLVHDLPPDVALQHLLLDRIDGYNEVPAADRLAELAALAGGRLAWCDSVATYLRELFDAGVTPMPMSVDSERLKLNELLRTSMMGGISKKLGDGLRSFLLRPEEGLGRNLKRIRANLDDCRHTRMQVEESRKLELEIHEVLDAGARMFAAAIEGARRFADERQRQADEAERKHEVAKANHTDLASQQERATIALERAEKAELAARTAAEAAHERSRLVQRANEIWKQRAEQLAGNQELAEAQERARSVHQAAAEALDERENTVRVRERDHQESAKGMADIQSGLERLHAHASRFRAVQAALARARALVPDIPFVDTEAPVVLARCEEQTQAALKRLVQARGRLETAEQAERAFRAVHRALERLAERSVKDQEAYAVGLRVLAAVRDRQDQVKRLPGLRVDREKAAEQSSAQRAARERAAELALPEQPLATRDDVYRARERCTAAADQAQKEVNHQVVTHTELQRTAERQHQEVESLAIRTDEHRRLRAALDPLAGRWQKNADTGAELAELLAWLQGQLVESRQRVRELADEVAATDKELQMLRNAGGSFPEHLIEACAAVDGRLLVERFEEVPLARAADAEARLGPLVHAVLVADPERAVATLSELDERPDTMWLLDGPRLELAADRLPAGRQLGDAVVSKLDFGLRLTRLPSAPIVGRAARERQIRALERKLRTAEDALADARDHSRMLETDIDQLTPLLARAELLDGPDPDAQLAEARNRLAQTRADRDDAASALAARRDALARLQARKQALETLWAHAALLDPPDWAERTADLERQIAEALRAQQYLEAVAADRQALQRDLDVLRSPPPDAATRAELERVVAEAQASMDQWLMPQADLASVAADLEALGFADAEDKIRRDEQMLTSLNQEVETAEQRLEEARQARDAAKDEEQRAEVCLRDARTDLEAGHKRLRDLDQQLAQAQVEDASDQALAQAQRAAVQATLQHKAAQRERRIALQRDAALAPQVEAARERCEEAAKELDDRRAQAGPAMQRWEALRARCTGLGLLDTALADESLDAVAGKASIEVFQLRQRWLDLMLERLDRATDGKDLADLLRSIVQGATEAGSEQYLDAWLETRKWLALRVPKHVSEVDDPVDALRKLRRYLDSLSDKLKRYEDRLQSDSHNIARAIEGRLRKVNNLLTKLNRDLRGVGFGSIEAIRVKSEREQRMSGILAVLSSPESQLDLFGPNMTIEEALDELFRRHGGRRDGGKRILDYREYLRLRVEVRRRTREDWQEARGNQMSTGEAIGVGAAIMMVVLTAWERDASLLRARREVGSLRFLFLDEATRLSLDNLEVLFDLCATLNLQLLVAAPEVATSSGNTTYLLQRTTDEDGREVVRVSGRRVPREPS